VVSLGDALDKNLTRIFDFAGNILKIIKWIFILIGVTIATYILYLIFGYLFYVGFIIFAPISLLLFNKVLEVPSIHILECRIGSKVKDKSDRLGLVKVPHKKFKDIPKEGGHMKARDSVSGKPVYIVEEFSEKKIEVAWMDKCESIEFYGNKEAFADLQKLYLTDYREILTLKKNWPVINAMEINRKYEFIDHTIKIEDMVEKFKKGIQKDDKIDE